MLKRIAVAAVAGLFLASPVEAQSRRATGVLVTLVGSGLVAAAFDYRGDVCPAGYTVHTYQNLPTQCVYIAPNFSRTDVQEATTKVRLKRKGLLWSGVGAVGFGVVLAMLPAGSPFETVSIDVAPDRLAASKTFGF